MNAARAVLVALVLVLSLAKSGQTANEAESKLHAYLFQPEDANSTAYNPLVRPVLDSNRPLDVEFRLSLKRLFELDETNLKVTLFTIVYKTWIDEFLKWEPKDFDGIGDTYVTSEHIWLPRMLLATRFADEKTAPSDNSLHNSYDRFPIKLYANGTVELFSIVHLTSTCLLDYGRFPLDIQVCRFEFQTPYRPEHVKFKLSVFYTNEYDSSGAIWQIDKFFTVDTKDALGNQMHICQIVFKRKIRTYLFTMPSYIVYILTLLTFLLPETSNERLTIGTICLIITTMLTYMLSNTLPHNDIASWPLLGKLYLFNIVLLTTSLMFSMFIINIARSNHAKSVPDWLKKFTLSVLSRVFCIQAVAYTVFNAYSFKTHSDEAIERTEHINSHVIMSELSDESPIVRNRAPGSAEAQEEEETSLTTGTPNKYSISQVLKRVYEHMEQLRLMLQRDTYRRCANNEWLLVAALVDKLLFFAYCGIVVFTTINIFKNMP